MTTNFLKVHGQHVNIFSAFTSHSSVAVIDFAKASLPVPSHPSVGFIYRDGHCTYRNVVRDSKYACEKLYYSRLPAEDAF